MWPTKSYYRNRDPTLAPILVRCHIGLCFIIISVGGLAIGVLLFVYSNTNTRTDDDTYYPQSYQDPWEFERAKYNDQQHRIGGIVCMVVSAFLFLVGVTLLIVAGSRYLGYKDRQAEAEPPLRDSSAISPNGNANGNAAEPTQLMNGKDVHTEDHSNGRTGGYYPTSHGFTYTPGYHPVPQKPQVLPRTQLHVSPEIPPNPLESPKRRQLLESNL